MMNWEAFDERMCGSQLDGTHGASARCLPLQGVCREGDDVGVAERAREVSRVVLSHCRGGVMEIEVGGVLVVVVLAVKVYRYLPYVWRVPPLARRVR